MTPTVEVIEWDDFALDSLLLQVRRGDQLLDFEPKAIRVLSYLIRHRGRVVTKEELIAAVWDGAVVSDNALTRVIAQIRKQLGDQARSPRYIETANTVGYRFIADVRVRSGSGSLAPVQPMAPTVTRRAGARWVMGALAVAVAVAWFLARRESYAPVRLEALRPLTNTSATEFWPSFSPDGSQVAFSSNRSGAFEIYLSSLAAGSAERALTEDGNENFQPAWSPDGQSIAYVSRKRRGIWVVPVSGGVTRRVADHGDSPAWSPDGKFLAFREGALDMNPGLETSQLPGTTIAVVGANGAGLRQLTRRGEPSGAHAYPRWTPDGRRVLFASVATPPFAQLDLIRRKTGQGNVFGSQPYVVEIASGKVEPIDIDATVVRAPAISPDGRYLYYVGAHGGQTGVWRARLNGLRAEQAETLVPGVGMVARDLFLAPDGKRIAFGQQTGESSIESVRLTRNGMAAGDPVPIVRDRAYRNGEVLFSQDGTRIAYTSVLPGGGAVVRTAGADGSHPTDLTHAEDLSGRPSWRADGAIGYRAFHDGAWHYFLVGVDGTPEMLNLSMDLRNGDRMRLSPDGSQLAAHVTTHAGSQIVVEDLKTHVVRNLTPEDGNYSFPTWSPDGRWLGVQVRDGNKIQLAYMPSSGGRPRVLDTGFTQSMGNDWAPDSDRIAFAGLADGVWNAYWISITTGKVQQLTHFSSRSAFVRYTAWSPKGDQIVFEHNNISSNIFIAELR